VLIDRQACTDRGAEHDPAAVGHRGDRRLGDEQLSGQVGLKEAIEVGLSDGSSAPKCLTPALLTNKSRPPNSDVTAPTSSWVCDTSLTSAGKADAAHPLSRSSPTSASAAARSDR